MADESEQIEGAESRESAPTRRRRVTPVEHKPIEGAVAKILTARELVINRGSEDGVEPGMRFEVLDPKAENVKDPETGEILGSIDRPKIGVEVTRVAEHLSIAQTFRSERINTGGLGLFGSGSALAKQFEPARFEARYETLKTNETTWEDLDESESFVKIGDPVRQIVDGVSD
jgi:hypothetical protein